MNFTFATILLLAAIAQSGDPFEDPFNDPLPAVRTEPEFDISGYVPLQRIDATETAAIAALDKELDYEFIETPLTEVAAYLQRTCEINVEVDARALAQRRIKFDAPITFRARNLRLASALPLMLRELDLAYDFRDGGLRITTRDAADENIRTYVLRVPPALRSWTEEELYDAIASWVMPYGWEESGGPGSLSLFGNLLVMSATHQAQRDATEHLAALAEAVRLSQDLSRPPPVPFLPQPREGSGEAKVVAALAKPAELNVLETPLQEVIDELAERAGVPIFLDHSALAEVGIGSDVPTTRKIKGVPLASLLRLMLRELDLTFVVERDVLLVTTPEVAGEAERVRVFPVGDLVLPWSKAADLEEIDFEGNADYESLIELITATVRPTAWDEAGGQCDIGLGCLILSLPQDALDEAADLLAGLRQIQAEMKARPDGPFTESIALDELRSPHMAKLRAKVKEEVGMLEFKEAPLQDVVDALSEKCGVPMQIDHKALEEWGIGIDEGVTATLGRESLGEALRRILRPLELTWTLRDDLILITTPEVAESDWPTRLYPVEDLVYDPARPEATQENLRHLAATLHVEVERRGVISQRDYNVIDDYYSPVAVLVVWQSEVFHEQLAQALAARREAQAHAAAANAGDAQPPVAAEVIKNKAGERLYRKVYKLKSADAAHARELAAMIDELVEPESWKSGEPYFVRGVTGALVVRHTARVQRAIEALLQELDVLDGYGILGGGLGGLGGGLSTDDTQGEK